ncbi:MAG: methyltransferase domain-containing protein [Deltaproteobacteria bacterium]|nr:MAG: methyltransferase domain-containing protein [Deltaproteobacteria bacterium]
MSPEIFDRLSLLSEPLRVRMLRLLEREELGVGELARVVQVSQPTVSRHLKQLHQGGFVVRRKAGTASLFRMHCDGLDPAARALWELVRGEVEQEARDSSSQFAEDLRRLSSVLAQRAVDSGALFRRLGSRWDGVRRELFGEAYVAPAVAAMLPDDLVIADLGCGTGATLPLLAPVAGRLIGLDREAAMLAVARQRTSGMDNVELIEGLLDDLPIPGRTVDVALCQLVLHHVADLPPVFREVARVLVEGGRFVIVDMVEHDRVDLQATMGHQHPGFSRETIAALAESTGLSLRRWQVLPPDPDAQGPGLFVAVLRPGA